MLTVTTYNVFLDTNVLIYQTFEDFEPVKHALVNTTFQQLQKCKARLYISPQIIREFVAIATNEKIFKIPLQPEQVVLKVTEFRKNFQMIVETEASLNLLQQFIVQHQLTKYRIHDANLAATAVAYSLDYFWTFNIKDFAHFDGLTLLTVPLST